ncbi:MAG: hypothetical protein Q9217_003311 [Psora testacea]
MTGPAICLSADPDKKALKEVARRAALQLTAKGKEPGTSQSLPWNDLPKEIRLGILSSTDLVDRYWSSNQIIPPQRDGFEIEAAVPSALFRVRKLIYSETTEIFSRNRFILSSDFAANRYFLCTLPSTVAQHLRTIDLEISFEQLYDMRRLDSQIARDWESLVASIASLLQLPKVWLSIDAGHMWETMMRMNDQPDHDYAWLRTSYAKIFDPLYQHLRGAGLRKFHVFSCWWLDNESAVEREVMGLGCDSGAEGKPSRKERNPRYPHIEGMRRK